jgi:hypothetical protein
MTSLDGPISTEPRLRIEELFVALLSADADLAAVPIVAGSNRDALVPPLHCFVLCREARPVLSVGQNYYADVTIVVASNIDDNVHTERKALARLVLRALTRREPGAAGITADARLLGWEIAKISETSSGQNTGDRIDLTVAAYVAG